MHLTYTLDELQTHEQRQLLDIITQCRECGLDSILSLPQIVVCGDQSAGKSSVLEALTQIPFPRNDNLCTRFATEINLRRETAESIAVRIVPDIKRTNDEQDTIKAWSQSITNFTDLPEVIDEAMKIMGIGESDESSVNSAFARDTLTLEISGPNRPQLSLVDIPGLIQASTKGVSDNDVAIVREITDRYISQPRTICLAVISATNDAANQGILQQVRRFDAQGMRTLGVITKPDKLEPGSGTEDSFLELARNEDVYFKLGWHVIKNRAFSERDSSFEERNRSEVVFFNTSNFKTLSKEMVGIDTLRSRLSELLHNHVKQELPRLMGDLERLLQESIAELQHLGDARGTAPQCRAYLVGASADCQELCKAALGGHYDHEFFKISGGQHKKTFVATPSTRLRAIVQQSNHNFSESIRTKGHKYHIARTSSERDVSNADEDEKMPTSSPRKMSQAQAATWVQGMVQSSRGIELFGSFNPMVIAELFWEQSTPWIGLAKAHIDEVSKSSTTFLAGVIKRTVVKEVEHRVWSLALKELNRRRDAAHAELAKLVEDLKGFPINYNHYFTDNLVSNRQRRVHEPLKTAQLEVAEHVPTQKCNVGQHYQKYDTTKLEGKIVSALSRMNANASPNMEQFSTEEVLDNMFAIYKVQQKVFVANVVTQVIERQVIRNLERVFCPVVVAAMSDAEISSVALESSAARRQRVALSDRIAKLEKGREIFHFAV